MIYDLIYTSFSKHSNLTKQHAHTGWEIECFLNCTGKIFIEGHEYSFKEGSIIIIPPNWSHYEASETEMTIACFSVKQLFNLEPKVYSFMDNSSSDFLSIFKQLNSVHNLRPINWEKIQDGLLNVIEQYVLSWNSPKAKSLLVEEFMNTLVDVIPKKNINLEELLKSIPISSSYFRKLFKAETGRSPGQYLMDQRIENAKQLLTYTTLTIKSVANMVGFSDPYYFSNSFKKATGRYPSEWRKGNW